MTAADVTLEPTVSTSLAEAKPAKSVEHGYVIPPVPRPAHADAAWEWWRAMGSPRYHIAPMVDQSELPFRMLCRRHGAQLGYTPMFHSRLFAESDKYRAEQWSTCQADRPLLAQFCANDPEYFLAAAKLVAPHVDGVDLNLGCPQRIARRGRYGAFLMDDIPLVEALVSKLAKELSVPVTVKIRMFPDTADPSRPDVAATVDYARRMEAAGAYLVAIHGRTRDQKNAKEIRADWGVIKAVKEALHVPVLGNGDVRSRADADELMAVTGVDGVLSAISLLDDPGLFDDARCEKPATSLDKCRLLTEYLQLAKEHRVPMRMVKGHVHHLLGDWLQEHTDLRDDILHNGRELTLDRLLHLAEEMGRRIEESGRDHPVPKLSERQLARQKKEAALAAAVAEQQREDAAMEGIGHKRGAEDISLAAQQPTKQAA